MVWSRQVVASRQTSISSSSIILCTSGYDVVTGAPLDHILRSVDGLELPIWNAGSIPPGKGFKALNALASRFGDGGIDLFIFSPGIDAVTDLGKGVWLINDQMTVTGFERVDLDVNITDVQAAAALSQVTFSGM